MHRPAPVPLVHASGRSAAVRLTLLLLGALPLLVTRPAPLLDWPSHVARMHILPALLQNDSFWMQFYRYSGFLVPNLTLDLSVLGLVRVGITVGPAAQLFLLVTYLVFAGGFLALARALDAGSPAKLVFAILLFYSNALFWGLVTYLLGIGLMFALLALWLRSAQPWQRLLIAAGGSVLLLFAHVVAAVAWILLLGIFDLCRLRASRAPVRLRIAGSVSWLAALAVIAGLLHAMPGGTGHDLAVYYPGDGPFGIIARKIGLFGKLLLGGSRLQDGASLAALLLCAAVLCRARPYLAPAPAFAVLALLVLVFAAPERVGTGSVLDARLAILPLLLLAAATRFRPSRHSVAVVTVAVLARTLIIAAYWHAAGLVFRDFRQQSSGLPAGSVMLVGYGTTLRELSWQQVWSPPITSIETQAVFGDVFVPAVFADPAEQTIALRTRYASLTEPWNLSDAAHLHAATVALKSLCQKGEFRGVYLTVLYSGSFLPPRVGAALLHATPDFLLLDACRLPDA